MTGAPRVEAASRRPPPWRRLNRWFAGILAALALFAPFLANDVPLVAVVDGRWKFPAAQAFFGIPEPGPRDLTWKQWWSRLPPGGPDWAIMPPWPYGPLETDPDLILAGPSFAHPLGNDDTGRDVLARLLHGTSTALGIGLSASLLAMVIGTALGGLGALRRGIADGLVLRLIEVFLCFPVMFLVLVMAAFFRGSTAGVVAVLALAAWPSFARIVRGEVLSLRERDWVLCARGLGVPLRLLLWRHVFPQVRGPVLVTMAFAVGQMIVFESTLAFLGLGSGLQSNSWGSVLSQGKAFAHRGIWHLWLFPSVAILAAVICCHALADDLRDRRPD
ncbi:MAG: hypothetical protein Fur0037_12910 [Planctomycetota bacterium]